MARFVTNTKREDHDTRDKMRSYWQRYSATPTVEAMMLSSDAKYLAEHEQNEVLSYLPNYHGMRILELGAGIGRFTTELARGAKEVTAVDFIEQYIDENRRRNKHLNNINYKCADVTKLDFPEGFFDIVFSNWLFMYLNDDETSQVFHKVIRWLSPGGYFFLRESCYHQAGNLMRITNPTNYRTPLDYCQMLHEVADTEKAAFKIIRGKSILAYIHYHGNPNQFCILARRVQGIESNQLTQYLQSRYGLHHIRTMGRIFGHNWLSTGGEYTTRDLLLRMNLEPGQRVLDVGCGTGGSAFYMARQYGVHVHGVDLSTNMIHVAVENQGKLEMDIKKKVQFEISDILTVNLEEGSYDMIYSRDSILYIEDKDELFKRLYRWLKPGGSLLITDYCRGTASHLTDEFLDYIHNQRRCTLVTVSDYAKSLHAAGFEGVKAEDLHEEFMKIHRTELNVFTATREAFIKDFSEEEYDAIATRWANMIQWTKEGQFSWGPSPHTGPTSPSRDNDSIQGQRL